MTEILMLVALLSCQDSPLDPSHNVSAGDSGVSQWDEMLEVDLEAFESTEQLRADRSVFATENLNLGNVFLDKDVAFTEAGLTRSMRYDWVDQGTKSHSIGRGILLPEEVDELWVEVAIRWSRNYTPCNPTAPPCAHKILFFQVMPENQRWAVNTGGAGEGGTVAHMTMSAPTGRIEGLDGPRMWGLVSTLRRMDEPKPKLEVANKYFDEQWHVLRLHARHSTDVNTFDGWMQLWMDGLLLYDTEKLTLQYGAPGFSTDDGAKIRAILLGRNKDKGLDKGTESMWIGRVRAWREDPGW